jgi:hypothetical protein
MITQGYLLSSLGFPKKTVYFSIPYFFVDPLQPSGFFIPDKVHSYQRLHLPIYPYKRSLLFLVVNIFEED